MQTIYLAGDSTAAQKLPEKRPETGWGEYFPQLFDSKKIRIKNFAMNGRSTKSFIAEGRLAKIEREIQPGDYLFIQFGHNDQKLSNPERGTHPYGDYQTNLQEFIQVARQHQATPILLTSQTRRKYLPGEVKIDPTAIGDYPAAMRQLAQREKVTLLDINQSSRDYLNRLTPTETRRFFMNLPANTYPNYPDGLDDNTHLRPVGAKLMATLVAQTIIAQHLPLAATLTPEAYQ